ncbi:hypothetical protein [Mycetocola zhadangensis]|uniref:Uncharacterized protein n=2 Tax=Mycetocola zhadangensis TaxID=1164595 RepID=A0A3L7IYZ1_9MICO|nr:hypothetical protein [Mycetocola zhadangensis]RLQ82761.1 hypothetical protein D9V28_12495 [Mycetocola zhadangensis]GGE98400.1 hypothetical protein GCM10011313_21730 [Mycetocola zhadangensis]
MKKVSLARGAAAITCSLGLVLGSIGAVSATEDERGKLVDATESQINSADSSDEFEALTLPAIPLEVAEYTDSLQAGLAENPQFNVVEISEDRKNVIVWWHGEESEQLSALVNEAPDELVTTSIAQTMYLPGDLKSAAKKIMSDGADLGVVGVSTPKDGSSLKVSVSSPASKRSGSDSEAIQSLSTLPVVIEESAGFAPANTRQNDKSYHLGGASIHSYLMGSGCSSGFSVKRGSEQGSMFAAHCGGTGEYWVTYDSFWDTSWYNYGTTDQRVPAYDGAIMKSNFSQPYMWTQGPTSTAYGAIKGQYTAPLGAEICYSGSQSGVVCGNIVQQRNFTYALDSGDLNSVSGLITQQAAGQPAAGNGDSGGPGYVILNASGVAARYATTIISAIPQNSGTNCTGNPGGGGRSCSATVISTDVAAIAAASGWSIQIAP